LQSTLSNVFFCLKTSSITPSKNVKNYYRRCQTLRRRVQSRVLLSEAKICVRIEMSPGRSATFMTDYWWSVSQWDDLFDDDKTSNDNWAMDFHKVQQLLFEIKGSKLLLLLLCCCCNPFFSLVCQVFTFLLLFLSAMNSSSSEWMTNWPSSSSKMHPGMCSNSVERAKKIKNWCERVKAKKKKEI